MTGPKEGGDIDSAGSHKDDQRQPSEEAVAVQGGEEDVHIDDKSDDPDTKEVMEKHDVPTHVTTTTVADSPTPTVTTSPAASPTKATDKGTMSSLIASISMQSLPSGSFP